MGDNSLIEKELKKLSKERQIHKLKKKENLFEEGSRLRYLYFVNSGKIKLHKTEEYGKEYIIKICKEGDFIGYTTLIKDEICNFSATALEESEVSLIPKEDFQKLLYANKDVASRLIKMLTDNVIEKEEQLLRLAYHSVRKRVAEALVTLQDTQKDETAEIHILRDDLARMVGTAKESVIRMLSEFKDDGYIKIEDGNIRIVNRRKLEELPN